MPYREITFENMVASYAPIIANKYKDTWGVYKHLKESNDTIIKRALLSVHEINQKKCSNFIMDKFKSFEDNVFNESNGYSVSLTKVGDDKNVDNSIVNIQDNKATINLYKLEYWSNHEKCVVEIVGKDESLMLRALEHTIQRIGNWIHLYGVDSVKHNEASLLDETLSGMMFQAMIYENMFQELYDSLSWVYTNY